MKKINKVNILGTEYEIVLETEEENPKLENTAGLCEYYSKKIILNEFKPNKNTFENIDAYKNKVLRHEIIHAFLAESGLRSNSDWAENEEMVDWFSIQFEKILEAFIKVNALETRIMADEYETIERIEE